MMPTTLVGGGWWCSCGGGNGGVVGGRCLLILPEQEPPSLSLSTSFGPSSLASTHHPDAPSQQLPPHLDSCYQLLSPPLVTAVPVHIISYTHPSTADDKSCHTTCDSCPYNSFLFCCLCLLILYCPLFLVHITVSTSCCCPHCL